MQYTAAVLTISDKGSRGERTDTSGPALCKILKEHGYNVTYTAILPDDMETIKAELIDCCDRRQTALVLTTGGTGFAPRDVTPEATLAVIERETRGIAEAMRSASMAITSRGCLSRAAAGIRGNSLIVNLPGSEKAAKENILSVIDPIGHGLDVLRAEVPTDCGAQTALIKAVCISERKGTQKHTVDSIELKPGHGIVGDSHGGQWHRQVSILGAESVAKLQEKISFTLLPGAFAENILCEGICLFRLPVGTRLRIGTAICRVTQIGKACHADCAIRQAAGDCVMPREGIFVEVLEGGIARAGDTIETLPQ